MADDDKPDPKAKPDPKERIAKVVELKTRRKERDNYIARLNARHAAVLLGTQTVVLDEGPNEPDEPPKFMALADFHAWYHNDRVEVPDEERPKKKKLVPVSKLWFASPQRRQYEKVVFDPTDKRFDHYNLWRGFSVQPDASKSCDKLLAHIRENICSNNAEHYAWVIGFLAHMVQRPEEKSGVTLVLRGGEGSGKGFLASAVGRLFREHYIAISQREHLVGRFNAHMTQALLIFVDEAMWAGDKQGEGVLKHLVTDHELLIEGKFKDGYMVRNLSRLIIASNEKWAVPAGMRARRWCVLDVADTHLQERGYFAAIDKELKNGGLEAFMHLLMTFDIDSVDIFTVPKTAALLEQKEESMHPHESWWLERLQDVPFATSRRTARTSWSRRPTAGRSRSRRTIRGRCTSLGRGSQPAHPALARQAAVQVAAAAAARQPGGPAADRRAQAPRGPAQPPGLPGRLRPAHRPAGRLGSH